MKLLLPTPMAPVTATITPIPTPMTPIGVLRTCFTEKFGVPRQSGLVEHAFGTLKLRDDPFLRTAVRELEGFSHLWLIFVFHQPNAKSWKPSIRPPRLGGAKKVGGTSFAVPPPSQSNWIIGS